MQNLNDNKPALSFIVPVYKVEEYLRPCVESILGQTRKDIEVILVDDGSPDKCGEYCDEYALKDKRVKVIHQENGGLSAARNAGIPLAQGEYISFVDSDDLLSPLFAEKMLDAVTDCDMAVCGFSSFRDGETVRETTAPSCILDTQDALTELIKDKKIKNYAWGKIYRTTLWNDVLFPVGRLYEDIPTIYKVFLKSQKTACIPDCLYKYRLRPNSISSSGTFNSCCQRCRSLMERYPEISRLRPDLVPIMLRDIIYSCAIASGFGGSSLDGDFCLEFMKSLSDRELSTCDPIERWEARVFKKKGFGSMEIKLLHQLHRIYGKIFLK